ncbi:protein obstructor-E-like [Haematobia irritans]|uniref:protein obstructor-E-like n=1 Tax=Haematobia irritans TaxID=7368 RepID=UPI003F5033E3
MRYLLLVLTIAGSLSFLKADVNVCSGVADNIFLPVLGNCSQYYICMDETPIQRNCQGGYLFDARLQSCTYPEQAQCIQNCTSALSSFCYDRTCTKYVLCYASTPVIRECCDGLQYNAETDRCDFPQYVDCVDNMCTIFNDPTNITFLASKAYCDKYYVCMDGVANAQNCSNGLQFNPNCSCCDFPSKVNCTVSTLQRNIKPFSKSPPKSADIKCPSEGSHFYPHAKEEKYYFCMDGRGVILECTPGLVYDKELETCREKVNIGRANLFRKAYN